jgi:hypothetical protein
MATDKKAEFLRLVLNAAGAKKNDVESCGHAPVCLVPEETSPGAFMLHLCCAPCAVKRLEPPA